MKIVTVLYLTVLSVKFHSGLQFAQLLGLRASLDMSTGDAVHDTSHKLQQMMAFVKNASGADRLGISL